MKIAIDISPLKTGHFLQHRVRGTGFYLENLNKSLKKYYPQNTYSFFTRGEKIPQSADVIHYPYFEPFFLTLPLFSKKKFLVTIHDLTPLVFPKYFPAGIKGKIKWNLQKVILKRARAIITDSNSSKKDIIRFVGINEEKVRVVYLAAGEEFKILKDNNILQKISKKYNLPQKFALYVGDVTWNKNIPSILEAVKNADVPLVIVGKTLADDNFDRNNPWNRDLLKAKDLLKNNKNIFVLGYISQEDLVSLYNLATVFVMPSLYEGFGLPILEAMNCGCPVVVSKEGSIPEIAGDAAEYVDAYKIDSIAEGIKKVFSDKTLQEKLSSRGILQSSKFSWKKTARETFRAYETVAQDSRAIL